MLFFLQKEMFASKVDGSSGGGSLPAGNSSASSHVGGSYSSGPAPPREPREVTNREALVEPPRERKLSNSSAGNNSAAGSKSKWMTAFKGIKGKKNPEDER